MAGRLVSAVLETVGNVGYASYKTMGTKTKVRFLSVSLSKKAFCSKNIKGKE